MTALAMGFMDQKSTLPGRGERVAAYVDSYLATHKGLSLGELAFRLKADKRDLQRLVRDRTCGSRLEESLHAYFGFDFGQAVYGPLWGDGPSRRERELERERAEIAARRERLERDRADSRQARLFPAPVLRVVPDEDRKAGV